MNPPPPPSGPKPPSNTSKPGGKPRGQTIPSRQGELVGVFRKLTDAAARRADQFREKNAEPSSMEIGVPTDVKHDAHVGFSDEGAFESHGNLPAEWTPFLWSLDGELRHMNEAPLTTEEAEFMCAESMRINKKAPNSPQSDGEKLKGTLKALAAEKSIRRRAEQELARTRYNLEMQIATLKKQLYEDAKADDANEGNVSAANMEAQNARSIAAELRESLDAANEKNAQFAGRIAALEQKLGISAANSSDSDQTVVNLRRQLACAEKESKGHQDMVMELKGKVKQLQDELARAGQRESALASNLEVPIIVAPPVAPPAPPNAPPVPSISAPSQSKAGGRGNLLAAIRSPDVLLRHVSRQFSPYDAIPEGMEENDMVKILASALIERRKKGISVVPSQSDDDEW